MADVHHHPPVLLQYRPWQGTFRSPWAGVWPVARTAFWLVVRRKLFWGLFGLGIMSFLLFFFGQYLAAFSETLADQQGTRLRRLIHRFLDFLDGSGRTYQTFINYQGYILMIILALAGSVVIGDDLRLGSLPYYLAKPLTRRQYLLGKGLAVAVLVNLLTTVPAIILWVEFGLLYSTSYFTNEAGLLLGILAYGLIVTVTLTTLLLATAVWLKRTVPLLMVWTTLFLFCRVLAFTVVNRLNFDPRFRLIDLWNNMQLVGSACLGVRIPIERQGYQPAWYEAGLVLIGVNLVCLTYLSVKIRAVEVVR